MSAKLSPSGLFAVGGMAATALFFLMPSGGLAQGVVFVSLNAAAAAALIVRVATRALTGWTWHVLAVSQAVYVVATAI